MSAVSNNLTSTSSTPTNPNEEKPNLENTPFIVKTTVNLITGAMVGSITYVLTKFLIDKTAEYKSFLVFGILDGTVKSALTLTHMISLKVLGDRPHDEFTEVEQGQSTRMDTLRRMAWRVISTCEEGIDRIDRVISGRFSMRTEREIRKNNVSDLHLTISEVVRKAFIHQIQLSFVNNTAKWGSLKITLALGYALPGVSLLLGFAFLELLTGWIKKTEEILKVQYDEYMKNNPEQQPSNPPPQENPSWFNRMFTWLRGESPSPEPAK